MKKIAILSVAAGLFVAVGSVYGQGAIDLNNFDSNVGLIVKLSNNTLEQAPAGTVVEILGGSSASSLTPLVSAQANHLGATTYTLNAGDVGGVGPGTGAGGGSSFDYGYAAVPGTTAGTAVLPSTGGSLGFFEVIAWLQGNGSANTFAGAQYVYQSAVFSTIVGGPVAPPAPTAPGLLNNIPGTVMQLQQVPEPATIALGGLGAAALLFFRRRK